MSHRFKKKAPSTAMYRHVAVITLVATGLLAVLADGENAKAVASGVEARRAAQGTRQTEKARKAAAAPVQQPGGVWGSDSGESGLRVVNVSGSVASFAGLGMPDLTGRFSPDYLDRLSPEERESLVRSMAENGADGTELAQAQSRSLEQDSRRRSGSAGRQ